MTKYRSLINHNLNIRCGRCQSQRNWVFKNQTKSAKERGAEGKGGGKRIGTLASEDVKGLIGRFFPSIMFKCKKFVSFPSLLSEDLEDSFAYMADSKWINCVIWVLLTINGQLQDAPNSYFKQCVMILQNQYFKHCHVHKRSQYQSPLLT